jgi:hypothetical protein
LDKLKAYPTETRDFPALGKLSLAQAGRQTGLALRASNGDEAQPAMFFN